jgi:hypothetical protein
MWPAPSLARPVTLLHPTNLGNGLSVEALCASGPNLTFRFFCEFPCGLDHASLGTKEPNINLRAADRVELEPDLVRVPLPHLQGARR